nr:MAG TPA: Arc-like DNA binding domain protein [Caudoviricetes sp.]
MSQKKYCNTSADLALVRPENKIKICVRVTPYVYHHLEEVARVNGVNVSVVARAFLQRGVEYAVKYYEDEKQM